MLAEFRKSTFKVTTDCEVVAILSFFKVTTDCEVVAILSCVCRPLFRLCPLFGLISKFINKSSYQSVLSQLISRGFFSLFFPVIIPTGFLFRWEWGGGGGGVYGKAYIRMRAFFLGGGEEGDCMPVESVSITMKIMAISAMNRYCQAKKKKKKKERS